MFLMKSRHVNNFPSRQPSRTYSSVEWLARVKQKHDTFVAPGLLPKERFDFARITVWNDIVT